MARDRHGQRLLPQLADVHAPPFKAFWVGPRAIRFVRRRVPTIHRPVAQTNIFIDGQEQPAMEPLLPDPVAKVPEQQNGPVLPPKPITPAPQKRVANPIPPVPRESVPSGRVADGQPSKGAGQAEQPA